MFPQDIEKKSEDRHFQTDSIANIFLNYSITRLEVSNFTPTNLECMIVVNYRQLETLLEAQTFLYSYFIERE